jgi:hypothetical protein
MKILMLCLLLFPILIRAQNILPDANTITARNVTFLKVCNSLLDSGYVISKKDNDLLTVSTESRQYPHLWNATYKLSIRIKDSCAYITGTLTAPPGGGLFYNEPIKNFTNKKGETKTKSIGGYIFLVMDSFARSLSPEVTYLKL